MDKDTNELYRTGMALKNGEVVQQNLRGVFLQFKAAAANSDEGAMLNFQMPQKQRRTRKRHQKKQWSSDARRVGSILGWKWRKKEESECIRYFWSELEAGELEAAFKLSDIYWMGEMMEKDEVVSERLLELMAASKHLEKLEEQIKLSSDQETKALLISGNGQLASFVR